MKLNDASMGRYIVRAVEALESIAHSLRHGNKEPFVVNVINQNAPSTPEAVDIYRQTKGLIAEAKEQLGQTDDPGYSHEGKRLPAYWMGNFHTPTTEDDSDGTASIDRDGVSVWLPFDEMPDEVRGIFMAEDKNPVAITVAVNYENVGE